jgi:tRNA dimethylallyltransferase
MNLIKALYKPYIMNKKTCIIICGPTASGKTAAAISVAKYFNTEIISADSRQCFKELGIAVAKPSLDELNTIFHHFINMHSIQHNFTAADYENYALQKVAEIFLHNDVAIMVGGTGLYIKAFTDGLDAMQPIAENIKTEIANGYLENGITWLQQKIETEDKLFFEKGEKQNPHRLIRALEVIRATGKSILDHQTNIKKQRDFNIVKIGVEVQRNDLYNNINNRVDAMFNAGLVAEAKALYKYKNLNALQTVGYKELFAAFDGEISIEKAIDMIKQNTRHYAKRQMTWFKKDAEVIWVRTENILEEIKNILHLHTKR